MELNVISIIQRKISHKNYSMRNTEIPNKSWYTTVNIWKSSIWTVDKDMSMKAIFTVIKTTWAVVKIRPEKTFFRPVRDFNPSPLWCTMEHCNSIAEVMGSNPIQAWIFFRPYFHYCSSSVYNRKDHFHIHKSWCVEEIGNP